MPASANLGDTSALPFDPRFGMDLPALLAIQPPPEPAGWHAFWQQTWRDNAALPLAIAQTEIPGTTDLRVWEINFNSFNHARIGGWLTAPRSGPVTRGFVIGHGYGGRPGPDLNWIIPQAATIFPCARGFHRSAAPGFPDNAARHVIQGIAMRDTYIHRGCVCDLWSAASALLHLYPSAAANLAYSGSSFGGGIGALAIASDPRFHRAALDVPSFANYLGRRNMPSQGSWAAALAYAKHHPEVFDVLPWFDAATAARHTTIPTLVSAALFDPAVSPPCQFAVYNALAGPRELFIRQAGHWGWEGEAAEGAAIGAAVRQWFAERN